LTEAARISHNLHRFSRHSLAKKVNYMRPTVLRAVSVCAALLTLVAVLSADIAIPTGTAYVQPFDGIGTTATATLRQTSGRTGRQA
jgi:hypothetical protein